MNAERMAAACQLVLREAQALDEQRWNDWLALYREDAVFWLPTWADEANLITDPMSELSFMYLEGCGSLKERVQRVISGRSVASTPIPRTTHLVTGVLAEPTGDENKVLVKSAWMSHVYQLKDNTSVMYSGRYEHELVLEEGAFRISRKKIVLINDLLISKLDFFYI